MTGTSLLDSKRRRSRPRIDGKPGEPPLMPFIDIIFQLLIFFLLTMKFRQHEGYLLSMLPDHGLSAVPNPEMPNEVRVLVCADPSHRMDQHLGYKERHQHILRDARLAGARVGDVCRIQVELRFDRQRELYRTDVYAGRAAHNRGVYADVAAELEQLARGMRRPGGKPVSVVLDLDGYVPYEHAIGLVNALQRLGLHDIEWAGNPRFDRYYGR